MVYAALRGLFRVILAVFYRRVEVRLLVDRDLDARLAERRRAIGDAVDGWRRAYPAAFYRLQ